MLNPFSWIITIIFFMIGHILIWLAVFYFSEQFRNNVRNNLHFIYRKLRRLVISCRQFVKRWCIVLKSEFDLVKQYYWTRTVEYFQGKQQLHFSKLPVIVQRKIFKLMSTRDVFALSLCSSRLAVLTENCKSNQPLTHQECNKKLFNHFHCLQFGDNYFDLLKLPFYWKFLPWISPREFSIGNTTYRIKNTFTGHLILYSINSSLKNCHSAIDRRLRAMYRSPGEVRVYMYPQSISNCFPNIKDVNYTVLKAFDGKDKNIKIADIESRDEKSLTIHNPIEGRFEHDSKVFNSNFLHFYHALTSVDLPACQFTGRHLLLSDAIVSNEDVIQFLNIWKSGTALQNLESVVIRLAKGHSFNEDMIYNRLDARQWNPERRPQFYQLRRTYIPYLAVHKFWNQADFSD